METHRLLIGVASLIALIALSTSVVSMEAQSGPQNGGAIHAGDDQSEGGRSWLDVIVGEPGQNNLYVGMWSHHFLKGNEKYQTENNLIGISYGGYYFGSFINSFDNRAWSVGAQRDLYRNRWRRLKLDGGYRAGLLYGYDTITIPDTKLGPLFQVYADISYRQVGIQFSWALEVVTAGFFVRIP